MDVSIVTDAGGDVVVAEVRGEVDAYTSGALRSRLTPVLDVEHVRLVVDLRGVTFLDSTGLSVLIGAARQVRRHAGEVHLVVDQERVINLFRAGALTKFFPMHATLDDALAAATAGADGAAGAQGAAGPESAAGTGDDAGTAGPAGAADAARTEGGATGTPGTPSDEAQRDA